MLLTICYLQDRTLSLPQAYDMNVNEYKDLMHHVTSFFIGSLGY